MNIPPKSGGAIKSRITRRKSLTLCRVLGCKTLEKWEREACLLRVGPQDVDQFYRAIHQDLAAFRAYHIALHDGTVTATPNGLLSRQVGAGSDQLDYKRLQGLAARLDVNPIVGEKLEGVGTQSHIPDAEHVQLNLVFRLPVSSLSLKPLYDPFIPLQPHVDLVGRLGVCGNLCRGFVALRLRFRVFQLGD